MIGRVIQIVAAIGGVGIVIAGLSAWIGKIIAEKLLERDRRRHNAELERLRAELESSIRKMQGHIDRTVFVHRVQFEAEFKAMRDIWGKIAVLRGTMAAVRPTFSLSPDDETKEQALERFWKRVVTFSKALDDAKDAIFQNGPFISEPLYQELFTNLLKAAQAEEISVRVHRQETTPNWYDIGEKNVADLCASAERASKIIRARIYSLALLPE